MGLASLIAASGALLGALIAIALSLPSNRRTAANQQLAALMLLVTLYQLATMARHSPQLSWMAPLQFFSAGIFLLGPGLYLYTRARSTADSGWHLTQLWHALPCGLLLLDYLSSRQVSQVPGIVGVLFYLHLLVYLGAALFLLRRAQREGVLAPATLRWLATLLWSCFALALPGLLFALGRWLFDAVSWPRQLWSVTLTVGMSYLIAFFAVLDPSVFHGSRSARAERQQSARYQSSSLTPEQARALWASLEGLMQEQQPYLQPQIKVGDLAKLLGVTASHLSQTINQVGQCSFATYLNRYRIEAASVTLRASKPGERTMLDIALSSGFNSESVFYKHFRSTTGSTPRQYQQRA